MRAYTTRAPFPFRRRGPSARGAFREDEVVPLEDGVDVGADLGEDVDEGHVAAGRLEVLGEVVVDEERGPDAAAPERVRDDARLRRRVERRRDREPALAELGREGDAEGEAPLLLVQLRLEVARRGPVRLRAALPERRPQAPRARVARALLAVELPRRPGDLAAALRRAVHLPPLVALPPDAVVEHVDAERRGEDVRGQRDGRRRGAAAEEGLDVDVDLVAAQRVVDARRRRRGCRRRRGLGQRQVRGERRQRPRA